MHPAWRAALIASAASDAAPRAEFAVPPRSRVAVITGAASGVETTAASAFRPRTIKALALDLGVPSSGARWMLRLSQTQTTGAPSWRCAAMIRSR